MNYEAILNSVECFHKTSTDFVTGYNPPYHRHEGSYEFYLYLSGNAIISIESNSYQLSTGDLLVVCPGQLHRCVVEKSAPYERICINIPYEVIQELSSATSNLTLYLPISNLTNQKEIVHLSSEELANLVSLTDEFLALNASVDFGADLEKTARLLSFLVSVNHYFADDSRKSPKNVMPAQVKSIMDYIESHLMESISLTDLSHHIGYSENYISSLFKSYTGLTLRSYILDKKIEVAKKLLLSGKSVSETSSLAGFNDYTNFIRSFKKHTGYSPKRYVGQYREV